LFFMSAGYPTGALLFYVDFAEYSINPNPASAAAGAGRCGECIVRLGLDLVSAVRRDSHRG
jgi:hypothetical protein